MKINKNRFKDGKLKCITFSYDDGRTQDIRLTELFRKYSLKGTFNLNGINIAENSAEDIRHIRPEDIEKIYDGFEIACHGYEHPSYKMLDNAQTCFDILRDREALEKFLKRPVRGFALPMGSYNADTVDILEKCGFLYSRTINSTDSFDMTENFLEWHPTVKHDTGKLLETGERFLNEKHWEASLRLLFVWGHSYELDNGNMWETMEEFCKTVSGKDDIWYATNMEICLYMKALDNLVISLDGSSVYNPSDISVWVTVGNPWGEAYEIKSGETRYFGE